MNRIITKILVALLTATGTMVRAEQYVFTTLAAFGGTNGANPQAQLVQGSDGNFYGTTVAGGTDGEGTIFQVTPYGMLTPLYSFEGGDDGAGPRGGLVQGRNGIFFGTTRDGGTNGLGGIFKISTNGDFSPLYSFSGADGSHPYAGLMPGADGIFYGTTYDGGSNDLGTVFGFATDGSLTTIYTFSGSDGANPYAGVIQGLDGNLYGTTLNAGPNGAGTLYQLTTNGALTIIFPLSGGYEGGNPYAGLVQTADGNLYGTTYYGGGGYGAAYHLIPPANTWFNNDNGANPKAGVTPGPDNLFYTVTENGGAGNAGALVAIDPNGNIALLHSFTGSADGGDPIATLVWDGGVNFYGTTAAGGTNGMGTVFRLTLISPPTCEGVSASGGNFVMQWNVIPGQMYQVQDTGNLDSTNWSNLGKTFMATNGVLTVSDTAMWPDRFYRVELIEP